MVLEAVGAGHVAERLVDGLSELAARIPVVLCTRVASGPVLQATYGYRGAESDLLGRGLLWGGSLPAAKARIFLALGLAAGLGHDALGYRLRQLAGSA